MIIEDMKNTEKYKTFEISFNLLNALFQDTIDEKRKRVKEKYNPEIHLINNQDVEKDINQADKNSEWCWMTYLILEAIDEI